MMSSPNLREAAIRVKPIEVDENTTVAEVTKQLDATTGLGVIVDAKTNAVLGVTERWRLSKAAPDESFVTQRQTLPFLVAIVPVFTEDEDVSVLEKISPNVPAVVVIDEKNRVVGTASASELWRSRSRQWKGR